MGKKYFSHRGRRYGLDNVTKTFIGELPFFVWRVMKNVFLLFAIGGLFVFISWITKVEFFSFIGNGIILCDCIYILYRGLEINRCRSCIYCSDSKEEVEQYIEKKKYFKGFLKDIQYEDGWYMLYKNEYEEIRKYILQKSNVYMRECPDKLKKLCDKKFLKIICYGGMIVALGIFFVCKNFFSINNYTALSLSLIPSIPLFLIYFYRGGLFQHSIEEFCKEEGISQKENRVHVKYDESAGGQLVFTVLSRKV